MTSEERSILFVSRSGAAGSGGDRAQDTFRAFHRARHPQSRWQDFVVSLPTGRAPLRQIRTYARLRDGHISGVGHASIGDFDRVLARLRPAEVVIGSSLFGPLAERARAAGARVVVQSHNCEFDYFAGEVAMRGGLSADLLRAAWRSERQCLAAAHLAVALTEHDAQRFRHLYESTCAIVVANPMLEFLRDRMAAHAPRAPGGRHGALFVGSPSRQNALAAERLVEAWRAGLPPLTIAGGVCAELGRRHRAPELAARGVTLAGFVQALDPLFAAAAALVCPLTLGSGIKIKMIEALGAGCRVLGSTEALNGFGFARASGWVGELDLCDPGAAFARLDAAPPDPEALRRALDAEIAAQRRRVELADAPPRPTAP